ncbi:hypothetical protein DS2_13144 [Catenovulum agarivorans DS-2]|uniref:MAPEG family protein n=1 Tax=Catenovulum agarivorans DS-2 TaxID=1328313 RepID=W7QK70_9ALTE|nr:MAPEG family protein [Catenovulum agarivorans]EWH09347.1 hypothetical protein DS2_13144 [Catenovulum agarivorans DS-2]
MNFVDLYLVAFWGLFTIILTWLIQWFVASGSKGAQAGAIPGKIDQNLSHSSFVFRSHRTFMNSIENVPAMLGTSFLAILVGADIFWTGLLVWIFAVSRIIHMLLYYVIATEANPSPRSYFFLIGLASNVGLLGCCAAALA